MLDWRWLVSGFVIFALVVLLFLFWLCRNAPLMNEPGQNQMDDDENG